MTLDFRASPQIMINVAKGDARQQPVELVFPDGVPASDNEVLTRLESFYDDLGGRLRGFVVTREANGNVLVRPEASFGN